jgi:DNA-binding CsgD family transcriptional regulator
MLDRFSATIQLIYAAAGGGATWTDALVAIEDLTGSSAAVINLVPKDPAVAPKNLVAGIALEDVAEWERDLMQLCPRVAAGLAMPSAPYVCDYMILSESEMARDPVYDWYNRHGLSYFVGSNLSDTPQYKVMWSLQRSQVQGHAQRPEIDLVELLKPHLVRALTLADRLGTLESFASFSSAMFEASPNGLFALDGNGTVLFANSRAEAHLKAADGICMADGRLSAAHPSEQEALDRLISDSDSSQLTGNGGWTRVSRPNGGPPYAIFVAPLNVQDEELLAQTARVLVIVHDTGEHRKADAAMLAGVYGLTDAEARLASALSAGHSIESAAADLGVQVTTVRSQLQAVFRKIGVNRQQDLMRLLASLRV